MYCYFFSANSMYWTWSGFLENNCTKDISEFEVMHIDSVGGLKQEKKEYRKETDQITIGEVTFSGISYLFLHNKFYGIAIDIISEDDFNKTIRYLGNKYGSVYRYKEKKESWWFTADEVIIVKRFSTHLAQLQIFCRKMFAIENGIENTK